MSVAKFDIRLMRVSDVPAVLDVWKRAELDSRPSGRDAPEALSEQIVQMGRHYWVAEHDSRIIGTVLGTHDSRKGWINRLAVDPEFRRQGLGAALLARVEWSLAEDGIAIFAALIERGNDTSCKTFESQGYEDYPAHYYRKLLSDSI